MSNHYFYPTRRPGPNGWKPVLSIEWRNWALPVLIEYTAHDDGKYFKILIGVLCFRAHLNYYNGY